MTDLKPLNRPSSFTFQPNKANVPSASNFHGAENGNLHESVQPNSNSISESHSFFTSSLSNDLSSPKIATANEDNIVIIGDIHGNFRDLWRVLINVKPKQKLVFLGDYVDRGEFSIEVITFFLSMMVEFPGQVTLLRGNHEFRQINSKYGFLNEIEKLYGDRASEVYERFNDVFDWMPFCCIVNDQYICVHGGITKEFTGFDDLLLNYQRPIQSFNQKELYGLFWADPGLENGGKMKGRVTFTIDFITTFLARNKLSTLVRGHQLVMNGVESTYENKVLTVFSTGDYNGLPNKCGFLTISPTNEYYMQSLPFVHQMKRSETRFIVVNGPKNNWSKCLSVKTKLGKLDYYTKSMNAGHPNLNADNQKKQNDENRGTSCTYSLTGSLFSSPAAFSRRISHPKKPILIENKTFLA
ncbi:Ser/Thr protein phosphatase [Tritrichomonas foetus]|uniref:Serine/threonine-protein phosphatase n=1 Tax=Tritrichomonas foetus TaxID=1144522 RepID=A0A1J4L0B3_9EUKA|nr:Ser/Thr protein phosphatase [Tritrichomonas foetus]|eukprot:OHT16850.1 Ser/Thr protein phosphatase [Tritrichomonas foetus]